jgi:nicotinamidase-related amidase
MPKSISLNHCCGVILDVQDYFLDQLETSRRSQIMTNTMNFARLLGYLRIPIVVTLETPIDQKGSLPQELDEHLRDLAEMFEKEPFDLTREQQIRDHLERLNVKQVIIVGCETDVCILQSCLGVLSLGYDVFVVEDLIFSSSRNVDAAIARMKSEGAILLTYKTLYYELVGAIEGGLEKLHATLGPFPKGLPDTLD